ncbi:hypothetical protein [Alloalcanivorax xenomutans]|uniref:hypothetical protein n=1 Tax=Alloalcanivorax xenomutans TaxID=1094342 RepID=UPI003BA8C31B
MEQDFLFALNVAYKKKIVARYLAFMERHGYRRPGGGASLQAILNIKDVSEFEDGWIILSDYHTEDGLA